VERIICLTIVCAIYILAIGFHIFTYNHRYFLPYVLTVLATSLIGGLVEIGRQRLQRRRERAGSADTDAPTVQFRYTA
jgi:hypothetical protein